MAPLLNTATVKLHNARIFTPEPSAIHCLVYEARLQLLALSRADHSIEVWSLHPTARLQTRLVHDPEWSSVETLAWLGARLFSCGLHGYVIEQDLRRLAIKSSVPVVSGACWCIDVHQKSSQIAAGTEEGYISLLDITYEGLQFNKILDKQEGRIMCVSWTPDGSRLASGSQDAVRVWDVASGHALHRISTGRDQPHKACIVWCIRCIDNNTFVSGDSRGKLCFWDLHMGVTLETHQALKLDVLCLSVALEGDVIYCSGIEPTIALYSLLKSPAGGSRTSWVRTFLRRFHSHDVRALAALGSSRLASGGVDMALTLSNAPPRRLVAYPPLPHRSVSVAATAGVILLRHSTHLELHRLGGEGGGLQLLLKLSAKPGFSVTCAGVSEQANWLAYSTQSHARVFTLEGVEGISPVLEKVRSVPRQLGSFSAITFSHREAKRAVVATTAGAILVLEMNHQAASVTLSHSINPEPALTTSVQLLSLSGDRKFLVAADLAGNVACWSDRKWQTCTNLPKRNCEVTAMAIHPSTNQLLMVYADHKLKEYSLQTQGYSEFSRTLIHGMEKKWFNLTLPITGVSFDPEKDSGVLLHDSSSIYVLDKEKLLNCHSAQCLDEEVSEESKKPKLSHKFNGGVQVLNKYKHVVHASWLKNRELCVVRVNPSQLEEKLPPAVIRKVYGSHT